MLRSVCETSIRDGVDMLLVRVVHELGQVSEGEDQEADDDDDKHNAQHLPINIDAPGWIGDVRLGRDAVEVLEIVKQSGYALIAPGGVAADTAHNDRGERRGNSGRGQQNIGWIEGDLRIEQGRAFLLTKG